MKFRNKGFTLIELLAVIVIIGVFLLVVVPSVTEYIADARKNTYVTSARGYISEVKTMITNRELTSMKQRDVTYYIPIDCVHKESGGESPYGDWETAFVVVTYEDSEFSFFWTSNDVTNMGILLTPEDKLSKDRVIPGITGISTSIGIGDRSKILVLSDTCSVEDAIVRRPMINVEPDELVEEDDITGVDIEDDSLRPVYYVSPRGWSQKKTVTITYPGTSESREYSLDGGVTWNQYTGPITFTANGSIIAKNVIDGNYINGSSQYVSQIDTTRPITATFTYSATSKSIKVVANGDDPESDIYGYQFSSNGGTSWSSVQEGNTYSFTNLSTGTYNIKIRALNGTYNNNKNSNAYLDSAVIAVATTPIDSPSFSVSPSTSDWVQKKTLTINYNGGTSHEYSIDGGITWVEYKKPLEFTGNVDLLARSHDGVNFAAASSISLSRIDSTRPSSATFTYEVGSNFIKVVANAVDNQSGILYYQFSIDNGHNWTELSTNSAYKFEGLTTGTYNVKIRAINKTYKADEGLNNNYLDSEPISISTTELSSPTYSVSPSGWSNSKTVTISYPSGFISQYSTNGGISWSNYSGPLTFTSDVSLIARVTDRTNYVNGSTLSLSQFDVVAPTLTGTASFTSSTAKVKFITNDTGGSGLSSSNIYKYCLSTSSTSASGCSWKNYTSGTTYTHTGLVGTYYVWIYPIKDTAGNINDGKTNISTPYIIASVSNYSVTLSLSNVQADKTSAVVPLGGTATFNLTPSSGYKFSNISCSNSQDYTFENGVLTVKNLNKNTVCQIKYVTSLVAPTNPTEYSVRIYGNAPAGTNAQRVYTGSDWVYNSSGGYYEKKFNYGVAATLPDPSELYSVASYQDTNNYTYGVKDYSGFFYIRNVYPYLCNSTLDVRSQVALGNSIIIWLYKDPGASGSNNQWFNFEKLSNGYYMIKTLDVSTSKVYAFTSTATLDLWTGITEETNNGNYNEFGTYYRVVLANPNSSDDMQQWALIPDGNGFFYIKNKATGQYVRAGSTKYLSTKYPSTACTTYETLNSDGVHNPIAPTGNRELPLITTSNFSESDYFKWHLHTYQAASGTTDPRRDMFYYKYFKYGDRSVAFVEPPYSPPNILNYSGSVDEKTQTVSKGTYNFDLSNVNGDIVHLYPEWVLS